MPPYVMLKDIIELYKLEKVFLPKEGENIRVYSADLNRPGLPLAGFFDYFDEQRIQVLGKVEHTYLRELSPEQRRDCLEALFLKHIPAVVFTRGLTVFQEALDAAKKYDIPILRSDDTSSHFMAALIAYLYARMAPSITLHGGLVNVYGEGVLLLGDSGVGKSETAIELVKRGHRLIADDAVEIRRVAENTLIGSAPELIKHLMELRGIGIVDIKHIFGVGSVMENTKIEMIIQLETWDNDKEYDRLGSEQKYYNILDVNLPTLVVPVKPGRNLAVIIEVAAINNRQRVIGHSAVDELNSKFMQKVERDSLKEDKNDY